MKGKLALIAAMFGGLSLHGNLGDSTSKSRLPRMKNPPPPPPPRKNKYLPVDDPTISHEERMKRLGLHRFKVGEKEVWAVNKKNALKLVYGKKK